MFSRNKAGSPSIQSRKHKLIYNRINFAPPPSPWLCWVFRVKSLLQLLCLIAILSMSPLCCKAGTGFVFVSVVLFTPVTIHSHLHNRWMSLSNAVENGQYSHRLLWEAQVLPFLFAMHVTEITKWLSAKKIQPWELRSVLCLHLPAWLYLQVQQVEWDSEKD